MYSVAYLTFLKKGTRKFANYRKALAELRKAVSEKDYTRISALIHKGAPLWETIRIGIPATELERMASVSPQAWDDPLLEEVRKLVKAVEASVEAAGRLRKEME